MSKNTRQCVLLGLAVVVGMVAYPPWIQTTIQRQPFFSGQGAHDPLEPWKIPARSSAYVPVEQEIDAGYGWLIQPPPGATKINVSRLSLQIVAAIAAMGFLIVAGNSSSKPT